MALLDIDRIPELMRVSPFSSYNRFNWASFHERDHFGDPSLPLRDRLRDGRRRGTASGCRTAPSSCSRTCATWDTASTRSRCFTATIATGARQHFLAEVNSTFGETHNYWLTAANNALRPKLSHAPVPEGDARLAFHADGARLPLRAAAAGRATGGHMNTLDGEPVPSTPRSGCTGAPGAPARCTRALARFPG